MFGVRGSGSGVSGVMVGVRGLEFEVRVLGFGFGGLKLRG